MGLDMYLYKEHYIGAHFDHRGVRGTIDIEQRVAYREDSPMEKIDIKLERVSTITEQVAYWRKANAIHQWFVDECQGGVDECQRANVSIEQLEQLLALCKQELKTHDALNPQGGFFFGSTNKNEGGYCIDEKTGETVFVNWFEQDIKETIKMLKAIIKEDKGGDYYYQSSW